MNDSARKVVRASYGGSGGMAKRFVKMLDLGIMPDRRKQKHKRRVPLMVKDARLR